MKLDDRYPELHGAHDDPAALRLVSDLERAYAPLPAPLSARAAVHRAAHDAAGRQRQRHNLPRWAQRRAAVGALAVLAALVIGGGTYAAVVTLTNAPGEQIMLSQYRDAQPALQPVGRGHVLGRIERNTVGFEYVVYSLRHPKPGCMGFVSPPLTLDHGRWHDMGRAYGFTCLSRVHPVDFGYLSTTGPLPGEDLSVIYARVWPTVHALRFIARGLSTRTVPVGHGFYLSFGAATNITRVQALDAHGRVIAQEMVAAGAAPQGCQGRISCSQR